MKYQVRYCPPLKNKTWSMRIFIKFLMTRTDDFPIFGQKKWSKAHF